MRNSQGHETKLAVEDLIDSGQFQRAEEVMRTQRPAGPTGFIHQVEIHSYFDRLSEAKELLNQIRPGDLPATVMARYVLANGEWYYWRFDYEPALEQFQAAEHIYRVLKNEFGQARALYNQGRLKRRMAEHEEAQRLLTEALNLIKHHRGQKKEYLQALIVFNLAICTHQQDQLDKAEELYSAAITPLSKLERGRYYGIALNSYGTLLTRLGKYEEALSVLQKAIGILQGSGAFEDLGAALNNLALTLIRLQRADQAGRLLEESLELFQRAGSTSGVSISLETSAQLCLQRQDLGKAAKHATEAIEQADLSHNDFVKAEALITLARVALNGNDFYAATKPLSEALEIGEKLRSKRLQTLALLYLAESEFPTRPIIAQERLIQARAMLEHHHDRWLAQEFERIEQRAQGDRMKITPDNKLIIDGSLLPNWYALKEAVETFMIKNALRQSGGSLTKAGPIIGISKVHVRDKKMQYNL
jgi:tetratricopeptide (TPR) repeat protein